MTGLLRKTLASQLLPAIQHLVARTEQRELGFKFAQLAWCVRTKPSHRKSRIEDGQLSIPYSMLIGTGVMPNVPWKEQVDWSKALAIEMPAKGVIHGVKALDNHLSIRVCPVFFAEQVLREIISHHSKYGLHSNIHDFTQSKDGEIIPSVKRQRVIVEYSSPNIAKPFHAGHLRSTIIGNFIANINHALEHHVTKLNYLGDWGTQFGLLGVGFQKYGSYEELQKNAMQHLFEVYVKVNKEVKEDETVHAAGRQFYKQMEEGNEEMLKLWSHCRKCSITEYSRIYERLGVYFDEYHGESMYQQKALDLVEDIKAKGLLKFNSSTNVGFIDLGPPEGKDGFYANLLKSDGTTLYITRDLTAAIDRYEKYEMDRIHYVVENGQHDHLQQLRLGLSKLGHSWANRDDFHIKFGRVEGMSTRRGEVVFLTDILDEAKSRMEENMKNKPTTKTTDFSKVADILGVSAVVVQDVKERRLKNYKFSWPRMLKFTGDTGIFLQYTHARLSSLERNADVEFDPYCSTRSLVEPPAVRLIQHLSRYDEVIHQAFSEYEPCHLTNYLFHLCHLVGTAHDQLYVKDQPADIAQARLLLFTAARITLANGLTLLGLTPLHRM